MSSPIAPYLSKAIFSPTMLGLKRAHFERKRKRNNDAQVLTVYLRINDAYSYLLLQVLEQLEQRYPIKYDFRTVLNLQQNMYPAPALWEKNAFKDGLYLSELYQKINLGSQRIELKFPRHLPVSSSLTETQITAQLLHWELQPGYLARALRLFHAYWQADQVALDALLEPAVVQHAQCYQHHLNANQELLMENGHYLSAMLHYGGEWYWGLDRLQYLERRLNEMGLAKNGRPEVIFDRAHRSFCTQMSSAQIAAAHTRGTPSSVNQTAIINFFSTRSPYSYVGLLRAHRLADYYQIPLVVKPVLPMVMRRMQVPKAKSSYIAADVKREAQQLGIAFGFIADPLGRGVENCYALYEFAQTHGKAIEFLESYARGVWAEGIRSDTHKGLKKLVTRAGLDWNQAKPWLKIDSWRTWAQDNLAELYANDLWGVPSFKYGDTCVFGQDRIDCVERAIVRSLSYSG